MLDLIFDDGGIRCFSRALRPALAFLNALDMRIRSLLITARHAHHASRPPSFTCFAHMATRGFLATKAPDGLTIACVYRAYVFASTWRGPSTTVCHLRELTASPDLTRPYVPMVDTLVALGRVSSHARSKESSAISNTLTPFPPLEGG